VLNWPKRLLPLLVTAAVGSTVLAWSKGSRASAATLEAVSREPVRVWYRSSVGCPDGGAFIELLGRLGRTVSLAGVGDRVDFVVNLAHTAGESRGRLERQSSERTVAIRDVAAASCQEAAEVLALSLDLALQPEPQRSASPPPSPTEGWETRAGAQATIETGLARATLFGAALFADLRAPQAWSLRLSLRGAYGERDASAAALNVALVASRAEACQAWTLGAVALGPCGGVDVGVVFAESPENNGRSDVGFWSSGTAHGRASWQIGRLLDMEAQIGLLVPFVRYRFNARTGEPVTGSAPLGLEAGLGFSFRLGT
jgi:hypothetical protein